jgi:hypothetical protein
MKNKARLSIMTAFSFGKPLKHLINDQLIPLKRTAIIVFCVRVTSQNETSKGAPEPTIMTPRVVLYCQSSSEGGIVLFRLLVSVYIRAEMLTKILKMEEGHADWAEMQLAQIEQMGLENYLINQTESPVS